MRTLFGSFVVSVLALLLSASLATAHEFIVKPADFAPDPGQETALAVVSAHVFMVSEEMEPEIRSILQNTTIDVADTMLKLSLALDPSFVVATLDD